MGSRLSWYAVTERMLVTILVMLSCLVMNTTYVPGVGVGDLHR